MARPDSQGLFHSEPVSCLPRLQRGFPTHRQDALAPEPVHVGPQPLPPRPVVFWERGPPGACVSSLVLSTPCKVSSPQPTQGTNDNTGSERLSPALNRSRPPCPVSGGEARVPVFQEGNPS